MSRSLPIPIISVLTIGVVYFFIFKRDDCVFERNAKTIFEEAVQLEIQGKLVPAYRKFKQIDLYSCSNTQVSGEAFDRGLKVSKKIEAVHYQAMNALDVYKKNNGDYSASLAYIRSEMPKDSLKVFDEFKLKKTIDGEVWISTGVNSVTFTFGFK